MHVMGFYLVPCDASTLERVVAAVGQRLKGVELLVVGNFNTYLEFLDRHDRDEVIVSEMAMEGLEDMKEHFLPRKLLWNRDVHMCSMLRRGKEVRYRTSYILGTDRHLLQNVSVLDPRHNTDHYLLLGCIFGVTQREHQRYLGSHTQLPLYPPKCPSLEDSIFASLRKAVPNKSVCEHVHASWISE